MIIKLQKYPSGYFTENRSVERYFFTVSSISFLQLPETLQYVEFDIVSEPVEGYRKLSVVGDCIDGVVVGTTVATILEDLGCKVEDRNLYVKVLKYFYTITRTVTIAEFPGACQ